MSPSPSAWDIINHILGPSDTACMEFWVDAIMVDIDQGLRSSECMHIFFHEQLHIIQKVQRLVWATCSVRTRGLTRKPAGVLARHRNE